MSISMCLVLRCFTGLAAIETALLLSHQIIGVRISSTCSSFSKDCNRVNSIVVAAKERYSDSVLDLATTVCFFELQEIKFPAR